MTGWGEASPWAVSTGTAEANVAALEMMRPALGVEVDRGKLDRFTVSG